MGDLESLLLVLGAIYLTECAIWIRRGSVAFGQWWGRIWTLLQPGLLLGNQRGSLSLANPLPPLGSVFMGQLPPLSVSPEAAFSFSAACLNPTWRPLQPSRFVRFEDLKTVAVEGKKLFVNGALFLTAGSASAARELSLWLRELKVATAAERSAAIKQRLSASLDTEKLANRLAEWRRRARPIRLLSNGLFVFLFLLVPPLVWQFGFRYLGWALIAGLLAQTIPIAILFYRAHGALYPMGSEDRFTPFLTMLLAPPTAIRAPDLLGRQLLLPFHPLATSRVLCRPEVFKNFARQVLLDLRYPILPICSTTEPEPARNEQWFRDAVREAIESFVQRCGLKVHELVAPPVRIEPENAAYCPRCGAQFVVATGSCGDCGGRALQMFSVGASGDRRSHPADGARASRPL